MLDLNSKEFNTGSSIFNNGAAGKADNNTIAVEKKKTGDPETYPDYKLVVTDEAGAKITQGFYYPTPNSQKSDEDNKKRANMEVGRVLSIAKAVVGANYEFPAVKTAKEAFDVLFKIVAKEAKDNRFNVFVTYGTIGYPSKYLGLRYFTFIEPAELPTGSTTRLKAAAADQLTRIMEDAPLAGGTDSSDDSTTDEEWEF